jgi:hypothetical protein
MKGEAKRDYPASISYQSPWYKEYHLVEDHFARVATALTRGKPVARVGVIHPIESYWLRYGPVDQTTLDRERVESSFEKITEWLVRGNIDFDFICESLLPSLCEEGGNPLKVGRMEYDAIVVPDCETLRSSTLERLEQFRNQGGKLIFMGNAPAYENAVKSDRGVALYEKSVCISFDRARLLSELHNAIYEKAKKNLETAKTRKEVYDIISDFIGDVDKVQTANEKKLEEALKAAEEAKQKYGNNNNNNNNSNIFNNNDNNDSSQNTDSSAGTDTSTDQSNDSSGNYKSNELNTGTQEEQQEQGGFLNSLLGGLANGSDGN